MRGDWHIHGFLGNVDSLTPKQIEGCWTGRRVLWDNPSTEKTERKRFKLGRTRVDPYDGEDGGYWYCVKQMEGYVTNVEMEVGV